MRRHSSALIHRGAVDAVTLEVIVRKATQETFKVEDLGQN